MPVSTYREWLGASKRVNSPDELKSYLSAGATSEGWTTEFKAAAHDPDYGVREAVAALGNARGGEVFLGVNNVGVVTGSPVTLEALNKVLRQSRAIPSSWRIVDLMEIVANITPVPLASGPGSAYVIEVRPYDLPSFILDSRGQLILPIRSGSDTRTLDVATAIEWYLTRRRAEVLRACLQELTTFALQLSQFRGLDDSLPDPLPYIHSVVQDGSAYRILTSSDRAALFGAGVQNGRNSGAVDCYYRSVRRVRAALSALPLPHRNLAIGELEGVGFEFSNLEEDARRSVRELRAYLQSQGISVP